MRATIQSKIRSKKLFFSLAVFFLSAYSNHSLALTESSHEKLYNVQAINVSLDDFAKSFKDVALQEEKTVDGVIEELKTERPSYTDPIIKSHSTLKLSFLLDHQWGLETKNNDGQMLIEVALKNFNQNVITVIFDYVANQEDQGVKFDLNFAELINSADISYKNKTWAQESLSPWMLASNNNKLTRDKFVDGAPKLEIIDPRPPSPFEIRNRGIENILPAGEGAATPEEAAFFTVEVPYATNRKKDLKQNTNTPDGAKKFYTYHVADDANYSERIDYGIAHVTIPKIHEKGKLESMGILQFHEDPKQHVILQKLSRQTEGDFFSSLKERINKHREAFADDKEDTTSNDIFLFVHGFNTDFRQALRKTAQLIYDMEFTGVGVAYSWPAREVQVPLPWHFRADVRRLNESVSQIRYFINKLRAENPGKQIHIVAHSLGSRIVSKSLVDIANSMIEGDDNKFLGEVIFAAPAIDAKKFIEQYKDKITPLCERLSIIASDDDVALHVESLAEDLDFTFPLGLWTANRAAIPDGLYNFDASELSAGMFSLDHSVYAEVPEAIDHMALMIKKQPVESILDGQNYLNFFNRTDFFSNLSRKVWKFLRP